MVTLSPEAPALTPHPFFFISYLKDQALLSNTSLVSHWLAVCTRHSLTRIWKGKNSLERLTLMRTNDKRAGPAFGLTRRENQIQKIIWKPVDYPEWNVTV